MLGVTGATGLIGRIFVREAVRQGFKVRLLARGSVPTQDSMEVAYLDLAAPGHIDPSILDGCQAVVHLAARIPTDHSDVREADFCWQENALGTLKLMEAMDRAGVKRLIQTTSANAYAPWVEHPAELAPMFPASRIYYLTSKIAQELYANSMGLAHGIGVATLRISSVYGVDSHRAPITVIARQMIEGRSVKLASGGGFGADFVTDEDVARALLLILESNASGPFNVASGTRSTLLQIARQLAELTDYPLERTEIADRHPSGPADFGFPAINNAKLVALGFDPTPLAAGLVTLVDALRREINPG